MKQCPNCLTHLQEDPYRDPAPRAISSTKVGAARGRWRWAFYMGGYAAAGAVACIWLAIRGSLLLGEAINHYMLSDVLSSTTVVKVGTGLPGLLCWLVGGIPIVVGLLIGEEKFRMAGQQKAAK